MQNDNGSEPQARVTPGGPGPFTTTFGAIASIAGEMARLVETVDLLRREHHGLEARVGALRHVQELAFTREQQLKEELGATHKEKDALSLALSLQILKSEEALDRQELEHERAQEYAVWGLELLKCLVCGQDLTGTAKKSLTQQVGDLASTVCDLVTRVHDMSGNMGDGSDFYAAYGQLTTRNSTLHGKMVDALAPDPAESLPPLTAFS